MKEGARHGGGGAAPGAFTRRAFLQGAAGLAGFGALGAAGLASRPWPGARAGAGAGTRMGTVLGAGRVALGLDERHVFAIVDLDDPGRAARVVPVDFFGHGLALDPNDAARAVLFEKNGEGACELDLAAGAAVRPLATRPERHFYGHGAFSPDGSLLYATESVLTEAFRGVIVVRDGRTLEELGVFPSHGVRPHDCVLRDGGRTLVVTNGGGRHARGDEAPCVTYVDTASERLLEKVPLPSPELNAGHLALTARGDLAVVSAGTGGVGRQGLGAASLRARGARALTILEEPVEVTGRMRGEALSVAIHEPSGVVGVTSPFGSLVTFWELASGRLLRAIDLAWPRGIALALDGSRFLVSYGRAARLVAVSTATLEPIPGSRRDHLPLQSSHIVVHALA